MAMHAQPHLIYNPRAVLEAVWYLIAMAVQDLAIAFLVILVIAGLAGLAVIWLSRRPRVAQWAAGLAARWDRILHWLVTGR
jgi:hypothetical protein